MCYYLNYKLVRKRKNTGTAFWMFYRLIFVQDGMKSKTGFSLVTNFEYPISETQIRTQQAIRTFS